MSDEITVIKCTECDDEITEGEELRRDGETYCVDCYDKTFTVECYQCSDSVDTDDAYEEDDYHYCRHCFFNREDSESIPERSWSDKNLPQFQSKLPGSIITSKRMFSAEIECYYSDSDNMHKAAHTIPKEFGITHDGSLDDRGLEFQTPKLRGRNGEKALRDMCKVLNDLDFTTNHTTGLHIHLDGKDLLPKTRTKQPPYALRSVMLFYLSFEEVILSFLPPSRRRNRYCKLMREMYNVQHIRDIYSLEALEKMWYKVEMRKELKDCKRDKYQDSRYAGVNFHSLFKDGHLEIRYHSGTINSTKILEWTALHQAILDKCVERSYLGESACNTMAMPNLQEKTEMMYKLLELPASSRAYFTERQALFNQTKESKSEASSLNETCAE